MWRCNSPTGSQSEERLSHDSPTGDTNNTSNTNENGSSSAATVATNRKSKSPPRKSGLTRLLEKFPSLPKNPFNEYAQFDGGMSEAVPVKKIMIFIAIDQQRSTSEDLGSKNNAPLEVVIVSTAKVQDLIGLICWQYTNEGREPKLHHDINKYCLRIAEDNGEVDPDFTSLNPREPLSKFNFPSLALTEKTEERVRTYDDHPCTNGNIYNHRVPSIAQNVVTSGGKISNASSKFAALTRIIFKDAKLDANQ